MGNTSRFLEEYFAAARSESGPADEQVRALVMSARPASWLRRILMAAGLTGVVVVGALVLGGPDEPIAARGPDRVTRTGIAATAGEPHSVNQQQQIQQPNTPAPTEEPMRSHRMTTVFAAAAAAATIASTPATAQDAAANSADKTTITVADERAKALMQEFAVGLGRTAADYWTVRLNSYKVRIDRTLSAAELEELNRLRVRFGFMIDDQTVKAKAEAQVSETAPEKKTAEARGRGFEFNMSMGMGGDGQLEILSLFDKTRVLSAPHRTEFDQLRADVLEDVIGFLRLMKTEGQAFVRAHESEVRALANGKDLSAEFEEMEASITELRGEKEAMLGMVYSFAVEPMIMLYNGVDIREMFGQSSLMKGAVTGITLPEQQVLAQSVPNPVSGEASIPFKLAAPSGSTTLRVFGATGEVVATQSLGSLPAGEHTARVDMSKQASGVYLYQLSIETPNGEQVYSRTMQVVR